MEKLHKHINFLLILITLLVGGFLRIYKISDYMTFLGDEGRDVLVVYGILHGKFTLLGPTASVGGFFIGPIYYYFMAPFLWLFHYDPSGPAFMIAILGIVTIFLVYKIGNIFFGEKAGLISAMLYAISPLVIAYSRSSWNPNPMPFFSLLIIFTLYKAVQKTSVFFFILTGILFGIAFQLHYIEMFLGATILAYVLFVTFFSSLDKGVLKLIKIAGVSLKNYAYIFIGFLIGWAPFLAFEARHNFPNTRSVINFIFSSQDITTGGNFFVIVGDVFFRLFGRLIALYPPPEQVAANIFRQSTIEIWTISTYTLAFFSVGVFLYQYIKKFKNKNENFQRFSIILFWFLVGVVLFGFYKKPIYDYYFEFMFPLPFLLVGNAFSFLWNKNKGLKVISFVCLIVLIVLNLQANPFRYPPNRQKDQVKKIADFVLSKTEGKPYNFALITKGNSDHGYRYFFKLSGKDPMIIQYTGIDPKRTSVTNQLLVVCEDPACEPLGNGLWEVAGFGRADIAETWNLDVVKVYRLIHYVGH